ncbi:unnamed protein product [Protopolystoma xenopodis]|uniref:Uncharacterized protein n=1 Tax=Protopolystoma xenopodis TaxID=117903 RepID=A0A448XQV0_9PLAT|nr:unnamed protein product [Protopolystoma xenopodis]
MVNELKSNYSDITDSDAVRGLLLSLETERQTEKSKFTKELQENHREISRLLSQIETMASTERTLRIRLDKLTKEIVLYKKKYLDRSKIQPETDQRKFWGFLNGRVDRPTNRNQRSSSSASAFNTEIPTKRKSRIDRDTSCLSCEDGSRVVNKLKSDAPSFIRKPRIRTLSLDRAFVGSNYFRKFNPTAYIIEQQKKRLEIEEKRALERRALLLNDNRSSSIDSVSSLRRQPFVPESLIRNRSASPESRRYTGRRNRSNNIQRPGTYSSDRESSNQVSVASCSSPHYAPSKFGNRVSN